MDKKTLRQVVPIYLKYKEKSRGFYGASFSVIFGNTRGYEPYIFEQANAACYGGLQRTGRTGADAIVCKIREFRDKKTAETAPMFFEWLFNYSPFRHIFVTKSAKKAVDNATFVVDPDFNGSFLASGLIASRAITENYNSPVWKGLWTWQHLVDGGVHPALAFSMAHRFRFNGSAVFNEKNPVSLANYTETHEFIDGSSNQSHINFMNELCSVDLKDATYKDTGRYMLVWPIWNGNRKNIQYPDIIQTIQSELKKVTKENTNPFDKRSINGVSEFGQVMEVVIPILRKIGVDNAKS